MPVTPESLTAFERLVHFFVLVALGGIGLIVAGVIAAVITQGANRAGIVSALGGTGVLLAFIGIRGCRKGKRMASDMRRQVETESNEESVYRCLVVVGVLYRS